MQTLNNARQGWQTRTILEEMRRESADALRQLLVGARPMPGVTLPRPCDVQPGSFIDVMRAKEHAMWLEGVKQAVGYDPRFLLPEGDKVLALPAPEHPPVEAVAKTRVIKLQAPAPLPVQAAAILLLPPARREADVISLSAVRLARYGMAKAA